MQHYQYYQFPILQRNQYPMLNSFEYWRNVDELISRNMPAIINSDDPLP